MTAPHSTTPDNGLSGGTDMALWITQTLNINARAQITLEGRFEAIGDIKNGAAFFRPETREEANAQAIALRLAAKRLEDIGRGL